MMLSFYLLFFYFDVFNSFLFSDLGFLVLLLVTGNF